MARAADAGAEWGQYGRIRTMAQHGKRYLDATVGYDDARMMENV